MLRTTENYRKCLYFNECGREEYYNGKRWQSQFYHYKDGFLCAKHQAKLISNPKRPKGFSKKYKRTKEQIKKYNDRNSHRNRKRRISFLNRRFYIEKNLRIGECSRCKVVLKKTHLHHWFYLPIMIWACTEELCISCHAYETWRLVKKKNRER